MFNGISLKNDGFCIFWDGRAKKIMRPIIPLAVQRCSIVGTYSTWKREMCHFTFEILNLNKK